MKKNNIVTFLFILISLLFQAQNSNKTNTELQTKYSGFRPVDPINYVYPIAFFKYSDLYYKKKFFENITGKELLKFATIDDTCYVREDRNIYFSDIPRENIADLLSNETVEVQISEITKEGNMSLKGTAAISAKNSTYQITMDYMKFVTVNVVDTMSIFSYVRVGVGLRLVATIQTKKKGINLGDLFAIGFAASKNEISGSLSVNILGIESKEITSILPMPSEISASSIQNAMQAMATIKSKIYDPSIDLKPQIISIRSVNPNISTSDLVFNTSRVLALGRTSNILSTKDEILKYVPNLMKF